MSSPPPRQLYPLHRRVIVSVGLGIAVLSAGLFWVFYSTQRLFTDPFAGIAMVVLGAISHGALLFQATRYTRRLNGGQASFRDMFFTCLGASVVAAVPLLLHDAWFYQVREPNFELRLSQEQAKNLALRIQQMNLPADHPQAQDATARIQQQIAHYQANPVTALGRVAERLSTLITLGGIYGFVFGFLFRTPAGLVAHTTRAG